MSPVRSARQALARALGAVLVVSVAALVPLPAAADAPDASLDAAVDASAADVPDAAAPDAASVIDAPPVATTDAASSAAPLATTPSASSSVAASSSAAPPAVASGVQRAPSTPAAAQPASARSARRARAAELTPARRYTRRSISFLLSSEITGPPTVSGSFLLDATLRFVLFGGLVLEPRLGAALGFSSAALGVQLTVRPGFSAGFAVALGRNVALTPMVGYDLFVLSSVEAGNTLLLHRVALELPLTLVFGRAIIEPYLLAGISVFNGRVDLAIAFGPRLGIVF